MVGFKERFTTEQVDSYGTNDTVWDDLRFPASSIKLDSTKPPKETIYKNGQVLAFRSGSDNRIYFNAQLPHGYKIGTDLRFHIHIVLPTAGSGAGVENVKFDFTYSWGEIGAVMPDATTKTLTFDVQNVAADTHVLVGIATVPVSDLALNGNVGVSSMLICSLERDISVANDYSDDIYLMEADFHYEIDSIGSDLEAQKRL